MRYTQQKINNGINATAAADGRNCGSRLNASDWSVSHYVSPREKFAPAMRPFVKIIGRHAFVRHKLFRPSFPIVTFYDKLKHCQHYKKEQEYEPTYSCIAYHHIAADYTKPI